MRRRLSGIRQCIADPFFLIDFILSSANLLSSRYLFSSRNVLTPSVIVIGEKLHELTAKPHYFG